LFDTPRPCNHYSFYGALEIVGTITIITILYYVVVVVVVVVVVIVCEAGVDVVV